MILPLLIAAAVILNGPIRVIDGDTIVAGKEHIRLLAVDSAEMPGHCRKGRHCAPGDPFAAKAALQADLASGPVTIERINTDRYGRTVGIVRVNGQNLSCLQLQSHHAIYWKRYDVGKRIAKECEGASDGK